MQKRRQVPFEDVAIKTQYRCDVERLELVLFTQDLSRVGHSFTNGSRQQRVTYRSQSRATQGCGGFRAGIPNLDLGNSMNISNNDTSSANGFSAQQRLET